MFFTLEAPRAFGLPRLQSCEHPYPPTRLGTTGSQFGARIILELMKDLVKQAQLAALTNLCAYQGWQAQQRALPFAFF